VGQDNLQAWEIPDDRQKDLRVGVLVDRTGKGARAAVNHQWHLPILQDLICGVEGPFVAAEAAVHRVQLQRGGTEVKLTLQLRDRLAQQRIEARYRPEPPRIVLDEGQQIVEACVPVTFGLYSQISSATSTPWPAKSSSRRAGQGRPSSSQTSSRIPSGPKSRAHRTHAGLRVDRFGTWTCASTRSIPSSTMAPNARPAPGRPPRWERLELLSCGSSQATSTEAGAGECPGICGVDPHRTLRRSQRRFLVTRAVCSADGAPAV